MDTLDDERPAVGSERWQDWVDHLLAQRTELRIENDHLRRANEQLKSEHDTRGEAQMFVVLRSVLALGFLVLGLVIATAGNIADARLVQAIGWGVMLGGLLGAWRTYRRVRPRP